MVNETVVETVATVQVCRSEQCVLELTLGGSAENNPLRQSDLRKTLVYAALEMLEQQVELYPVGVCNPMVRYEANRTEKNQEAVRPLGILYSG